MILTVTLNPSVDHSVSVARWRKGRTNRPTAFWRDPGGKGVNVSRIIHRLGGDTTAYVLVGGAPGQLVREALEREGVALNLVEVGGDTRINTIITDLSDGTQTRLNLPGPQVSADELETLYQRLDAAPDPAFFVVGGSLPQGVLPEVYETLISAFKARGVRTILDADGDPLRCGVRALPYLIKPNEFEIAELVGERLRNLEEFIAATEELVGKAAEVVVVSIGEQGGVAAGEGHTWRVRSPHVEPVSAVGAGDSMVGALALALARGESLEDALRWGTAAGAAAVMTPGTELSHPKEIHRLLPHVQVERIR